MSNYGCWQQTSDNKLRTNFKCKSCKVTLHLNKTDVGLTASMHGHFGRAHTWSNKSHLKPYLTGFQLFPTVETFIVSEAVRCLTPKGKTISPNKIERFVKDEMQKHFMVNFFIKELRE
jgi:hypothetical protein